LLSANLIGADVSLKPLQWTGKFADIDLVRGADLRGRNLLLAWAPGAFLVKANLAFANLYNANLMSANLKQAHFEQADLRYANLDFADLQQSTLIMANLEHAYLQGAKLQEANLGWANLKHANLGGANLEGAKFLQKEQVMAASCWQLAKYPQEMLPILHLSPNHNENLDKKNLILCQLPGADLRKANLLGFNLWGANLQGADLEDAIFAWADLREANLFMANLKGADLRDARGLTREKLQSAIMDEHTKLPDELKDLIPSRTKKP
jgi:uncharacterized protein YjbI with pentapeptide repeats